MSLLLRIRFLSYWRAGTGRGRAGSFDAQCLRDDKGLPYLPGKHLRGLLREAIDLAHACNKSTHTANELFGSRVDRDAEQAGQESQAGILRVGNAHLPSGDLAALAGQEDKLVPFLFDVRRSTAIDPDTRTAKPKSLRMEEVALPIALIGTVTGPPATSASWNKDIRAALPLIRTAGAGRTRGLGRCIITVDDIGDTANA